LARIEESSVIIRSNTNDGDRKDCEDAIYEDDVPEEGDSPNENEEPDENDGIGDDV